jgi:hypothetical protein
MMMVVARRMEERVELLEDEVKVGSGVVRSSSGTSSMMFSGLNDGALDGGRDVDVDPGLDDGDGENLFGLYVRGIDVKENGKLLLAYVRRGLTGDESAATPHCTFLLEPREGMWGRGNNGIMDSTFFIRAI